MASIEPISAFFAKHSRYPGNNKQWWVARTEVDSEDGAKKVGDFDPEILDKLFSGNNRAPRGHFILNAFNKDRSSVSGVSGLETEVIDERPTTVTFFSGRVWFACNSNVYFSQLLTEKYKAGLCYQEADPTSEDISDLIATDGGIVPIPEAIKILRLVPNAGGILIFATNGVWNITGTNNGFSALDISVNKISPIGCKSPMSIVDTEAGIFWWSDVGILGMQQKNGMYGPIPGSFERNNITETTIQSLYNEISEDSKAECKAVFDAQANRIMWMYRDEEVSENQYNWLLNFDLTLGAFYPWKITYSDSATQPYLKGAFVSQRTNTIGTPQQVVANNVEVEAAGEDVVDELLTTSIFPSSVEFFAMNNTQGRIAQFSNTNFVDWEGFNGGLTYSSYVETGYQLFDDAMRNKNITYLFAYLRRTEDSWSIVDGEEVLSDPSSCFLTVKWDWSSSDKSNKWSTPVQVYRFNRFIMGDEDGTFDTGYPIVVTKSKVRGSGKSMQFRFGTDEAGRNFDLHGWSVAITGNTLA